MTEVNLLPKVWIMAGRRRARIRAWSYGCAAYTAMILATWAVASDHANDAARIRRDLESAQAELNRREVETGRLATETATLQKVIRASDLVSDHADWGLLLALLADARGDTVVLDRVDLQSRAAASEWSGKGRKPAGVDTPLRSEYTLTLSGMGRTQRDVAEFVGRLEAVDLFDSVQLTETRSGRIGAGGASVVTFGAICTMSEPRRRSEAKP